VLELKIGSLESEKITIGSLESEKSESPESEKIRCLQVHTGYLTFSLKNPAPSQWFLTCGNFPVG